MFHKSIGMFKVYRLRKNRKDIIIKDDITSGVIINSWEALKIDYLTSVILVIHKRSRCHCEVYS